MLLQFRESEFSQSIDLSGADLRLGKVFVMWKFSWHDQSDKSDKSTCTVLLTKRIESAFSESYYILIKHMIVYQHDPQS